LFLLTFGDVEDLRYLRCVFQLRMETVLQLEDLVNELQLLKLMQLW